MQPAALTTFAIIGMGHIGKRHAALIQEREDAQLVACCDTDPQLRQEAPAGVVFFDDTKEMFEAVQADVVCVCSPNGWHARHAIAALNRGSHVVIEKPMALNSDDCEQIMHVSLQTGKLVFCVMQNRYSPPSVWLKDIMKQNLLGDVYQVNVQCFWNRSEDYYSNSNWKGTLEWDGGVLFTQFSHFIDLYYWMFGDIKNISGRMNIARAKTHSILEDNGAFTFDLARGGIGSLQFSSSVHESNFASSLIIIAENGTVKIGGQYMNELLYCDIKGYETPVLEIGNPANNYGQYKGSAANHVYIFDNVLDTISGKSPITTNALEGMKVVSMIERMYKAAGVPLPNPSIQHVHG